MFSFSADILRFPWFIRPTAAEELITADEDDVVERSDVNRPSRCVSAASQSAPHTVAKHEASYTNLSVGAAQYHRLDTKSRYDEQVRLAAVGARSVVFC